MSRFNSINWTFSVAQFILLGLYLMGGSVYSQCGVYDANNLKRKEFPLYVRYKDQENEIAFDGHIPVFFEFCVKDVNKKIESVKNKNNLMIRFLKFVEAIRTNESKKIYDLVKPRGDGSRGMSKKGFKRYISILNKYYGEMIGSSTLLYNIYDGDDRYLTIKYPERHENGELIFPIRFTNKNGTWYLNMSSANLTRELIGDSISYQYTLRNKREGKHGVDKPKEQNIIIKDRKSGFKIKMNGSFYEHKKIIKQAGSRKTRKLHPALTFYLGAYKRLENGGLDAFSNTFAEFRKKQYKKWNNTFGKKKKLLLEEKLSGKSKFIVFMIKAPPLFYVFYRKKKAAGANGFTTHLFHDTLLKRNDSYVILNVSEATSFSSKILLDQLFNSDGFQTKLKSILEERSK